MESNINQTNNTNIEYEGLDVFLSSKNYLRYCISKSIIQGLVMLIGFITGIILMVTIFNNIEEIIKSLERFLINSNIDLTLDFESSSNEISFSSDSSLFTIGSIACMWVLFGFAKNKKKTNWPFQVLYAINLIIFIGNCISLCLLLFIPAGLAALHSFVNLEKEFLIIIHVISIFILISVIINFIYSLFKMKTFKKIYNGFTTEAKYIPEADKLKKTSYVKIGYTIALIFLSIIITVIVFNNYFKYFSYFNNISVTDLVDVFLNLQPFILTLVITSIISLIVSIFNYLFDIKLIDHYNYFIKNRKKLVNNEVNEFNNFDFE